MCMPKMPPAPKSPPPPPSLIDPAVLAGRDRQRRALINSQGFRSTILTGPMGLGGTLSPPTLLGGSRG